MDRLDTKLRAAAATIGALSESTGVKIETIRYYERIGLLPAPPRSTSRHRLYEEDHRQRLTFIRRARELGFSLDDVRALLGLAGRHGAACDKVKALTEAHIKDVRQEDSRSQKAWTCSVRSSGAMPPKQGSRVSDPRSSERVKALGHDRQLDVSLICHSRC